MRILAAVVGLAVGVLLALTIVPAAAAPGGRAIPLNVSGRFGVASTGLGRPTTGTRLAVPAPTTCDGGFDAVSSPSGAQNSDLFATAAISANDVWTVGISNSSSTTPDRTLAEHWNGSTWSIVSTPNPSSFPSDLNGVAAVSSNDVWAVGAYITDTANDVATFAEHWNGSTWTLVPTPVLTQTESELLAVTAISSSDVWAVGTYVDLIDGLEFTLAEHWNGSSWAVASPTALGYDSQLYSVSAFSSTDVWAVGSQEASAGAAFQTLADHWDGSSWTTVTTPNETGSNEIIAVNALEAGHAVGVGYGNYSAGTTPRQGEAWDLLVSPGSSTNSAQAGPGLGDNALLALDRSGSAMWAVGYSRALSASARQTLAIAATWDSSSHVLTWGTPGVSASPGGNNNAFYAVSAVSPYSFWAAGYQNGTGLDQTLIEDYCALHFSLAAPASASSGASFSVTVTVQDGAGTAVTGYRGTVHFTSSDAQATLPGNYTFTSVDSGTHTFPGVTLRTPCSDTITASDLAMPFTAPGSATLALTPGACQGSAGTPGTRAAGTSSAGTPGNRAANQSIAGSGGQRRPLLGAMTAGAPASTSSRPAALGTHGQGSLAAAPQLAAHASVPEVVAPPAGPVDAGVRPSITVGSTIEARPVAARIAVPEGQPALPIWFALVSAVTVLLAVARLGRKSFETRPGRARPTEQPRN